MGLTEKAQEVNHREKVRETREFMIGKSDAPS